MYDMKAESEKPKAEGSVQVFSSPNFRTSDFRTIRMTEVDISTCNQYPVMEMYDIKCKMYDMKAESERPKAEGSVHVSSSPNFRTSDFPTIGLSR